MKKTDIHNIIKANTRISKGNFLSPIYSIYSGRKEEKKQRMTTLDGMKFPLVSKLCQQHQ